MWELICTAFMWTITVLYSLLIIAGILGAVLFLSLQMLRAFGIIKN